MKFYRVLLILVVVISCGKRESKKPDDFDQFWEESILKLETNVSYKEIIKDSTVEGKKWNLFRLKSYDDIYIHAWVSEPTRVGHFPIKIRFSGMSKGNTNSNYIPNAWFLKETNTINVLVDIRGQGLSVDQIGYEKFLTNGLKEKETYIYKGAYLDAVCAVEFISSHPKSDGNIIVTGSGQGGTLSIAATVLNPKVTMCVVGFPFLSDILNYDKKQWPMNVYMHYCKDKEVDYFELLNTLSYFDMIHFADKVKVPIFIKAQKIDKTTPLNGILKFYDKIKTEHKNIYIEPCEGHGCSSKSKEAKKLEEAFIKANLVSK